VARSKTRSNEAGVPLRCRKPRCIGLRVCARHGGASPAAVDKRNRTKAVARLLKFVTPIPGDDIEANPIAAFELEFRRTIAKIRYLDEMILELDPEQLGWGKAEEKRVGSGEFPGTDITSKAQANVFYEMQLRERKHLVELIKIWIGAKLDVRKLEIEAQKVDALNGVVVAILTKLGHDVHDPELRRTVREEMLALPVAGSDSAKVVATAKDIVSTGHSLVREAETEARKRGNPRDNK
jgi:hypothetical protein